MTNSEVRKGRLKSRSSEHNQIPEEMLKPVNAHETPSNLSSVVSDGLEKTYAQEIEDLKSLVNRLQGELSNNNQPLKIAGYDVRFELVDPKDINPNTIGFNRAESEFKNIEDIKESIIQDGVITPLHLRESNDPSSPYKYQRIAGETRVRIALQLGISVAAFVFDNSLDDKTFERIADTENSKRRSKSDLSDGLSYISSLERGVFSSQTELAECFKITPARVNQKINLAKYFPDNLVEWFDDSKNISTARLKNMIDVFKKSEKGDTYSKRSVEKIGEIYLKAYSDNISDKSKCILLNNPAVLSDYFEMKKVIGPDINNLSKDDLDSKIYELFMKYQSSLISNNDDRDAELVETKGEKARRAPQRLFFRTDLRKYSDLISYTATDNSVSLKLKGEQGKDLGISILGCMEQLTKIYDDFTNDGAQAEICLRKVLDKVSSDRKLFMQVISEVREENLKNIDNINEDDVE